MLYVLYVSAVWATLSSSSSLPYDVSDLLSHYIAYNTDVLLTQTNSLSLNASLSNGQIPFPRFADSISN